MKQLASIRFGPSGYPDEARGSVKRVFEILNEVHLDALEYAAVYGLRVSEEKALEIGDLAKRHGIAMSMHAAYFISLISKDPQVRKRSRERLVKALKFAPLMEVKRIVFHAGGYSGHSPEEAYTIVRDALVAVQETAGRESGGPILMPEIAGKLGAFGSIDELVGISQEVDYVLPTIDWAHLYARSQGEINSREHFLQVLETFEKALGKKFTDNMHFHVSGITFTERGEKSHRPLGGEWGPDILPLMEIVREVGYKPTFISETPPPLTGALYTKFLLEELERVR